MEGVPSTSSQFMTSDQSITPAQSKDEEQETNELEALGISAYDQTELETELIAQVNVRIQEEEDASRLRISQAELKIISEELKTVKTRLRHIDKALQNAPKETDPGFSKEVKRFILSIKQEKETKLKQVKKMEARQKMLLKQCESGVTREAIEELLAEDEDVEMDDDLKAHLECMFGQKETEQEKMIKLGQMTPFGTVMKQPYQKPKIKVDNDMMTDFEKYLMDQSNKQNEKKKQLKAKKQNVVKKPQETKQIEKSKENKNIVKKKVERKDDFIVCEKADRNSDSDWLPDDDDEPHSSFEATKPKKRAFDEINLSEDSDDEAKIRKRAKSSGRTIDDGNQSSYHRRLKEYKKMKKLESLANGQSETQEEEYEEFEGGYRLMNPIWEKLYDYQKTGVRWLWELHLQNCGGILGDEMGLGKTIQIITFLTGLDYSQLKTNGDSFRGLGPTLIICPTTLMHQWVKEFHTWWPPFRVAVLHETGSHSGTKEALVRNVHKDNGVVVTSYNGVVKHQELLVSREWHYVILDEGHKIRNPDAQITIACKQLKTCHRLLLSGSPVQNNLKELWSLFDFIFPGKLGTLPVFMQQFSVPIVQGGYSNATQVQVETSYRCALVLRDTINPYLLRRMKSDVKMSLQLPNKNEQVLFCRLTEEQVRCYKEYLGSKEVHNILHGRLKVFMGLIALRKICNHPDLYSGGPEKMAVVNNAAVMSDDETMKYGYFKRSGKMVVIDSLLKLWKKQEHRVLLFSQSKQMLDIFERFVQIREYKYMRMDGSTNIASRQPAVNKFNEDKSIFVFLLTTRVGGLGVNLTGANRVVIFDPDWNPSTDTQARERAWRIGQDRNVTIYRLITSGTIEEKVYHRQIFKQFLTNKVLKDPRQKRFFKNNELHELFTLVEDGKAGTETAAIFAGTGSEIEVSPKKKADKRNENKKEKMRILAKQLSQMVADPNFSTQKSKKKKKSHKKSKKSTPAYVEGHVVDNVSKLETYKPPVDDETEANAKQDDYVLNKLFAKSGVHSALKHDAIMNSGDPDYMLVEGEADRVAKAAVKALKQSRRMCAGPGSGVPTWTGQRGAVVSKNKFGKKKNARFFNSQSNDKAVDELPSKPSSSPLPENSVDNTAMFSGPKNTSNEDPSSSSLLSTILKRSRNFSSSEEGSDIEEPSEPRMSSLTTSEEELLADVRDFIAFQAIIDGQATTQELLTQFKDKIPTKNNALFKSMLNQICTFHRDFDGTSGVWRLKSEFR